MIDLIPDNKDVFLARIYENAGHEGMFPFHRPDYFPSNSTTNVAAASKSVAQRVEEAVDRLVFFLSTISR